MAVFQHYILNREEQLHEFVDWCEVVGLYINDVEEFGLQMLNQIINAIIICC